MAYTNAKLKSNGDKTSPCFKPFFIGNMSDKCLSSQTLLYVSFRHIFINLNTLRICNIYCLSTATMVARTRLIVTLYYIACLVYLYHSIVSYHLTLQCCSFTHTWVRTFARIDRRPWRGLKRNSSWRLIVRECNVMWERSLFLRYYPVFLNETVTVAGL